MVDLYIKVDKSEFKKAIGIAQKALPSIVVQEERGHLLVRVRTDKILISATNNDLKAICSIPLTEPVSSDFSFTVDPKSVTKLLTKVKLDVIKIEVDQEKFVARYFTSENGDSFAESQSFPESVMLTFDETLKDTLVSISIKKDVVAYGVKYAGSYLEDLKVQKDRYDFIIINEGLIYAANGSNKMGFLVCRSFKNFNNFKIRKIFAPIILKVLESLPEEKYENVTLFETANDIGVRTEDGYIVFSCLKSAISPPDVKRDQANTNGPYCIVNRKEILETIDRLGALDKSLKSFGIIARVKGGGDDATLEMTSLTSLKSKEIIKCKRMDESSEDVEHVVDNRLFRGVISSFNKDKIRLFIIDNNKLFKVFEKGELDVDEYHSFGIGAYAKAR